jgi:hypothetical protein
MRITKEQKDVAGTIDWAIRDEEFLHVPLVDGARAEYARWYAVLLSTLTIIVSTSEIAYSQTDYSEENGTVRFILLTPELLIVTDVEELSSDEPRCSTQIVGRRTLTALTPSASMRLDEDRSHAYAWPGLVEIAASYEGLDDPVVYRQPAYRTGAAEEQSPILDLLASLQIDLVA